MAVTVRIIIHMDDWTFDIEKEPQYETFAPTTQQATDLVHEVASRALRVLEDRVADDDH